MNIQVGKSAGIALLMAAALLAALFAMGVFGPVGVDADVASSGKQAPMAMLLDDAEMETKGPAADADTTLKVTFQVDDEVDGSGGRNDDVVILVPHELITGTDEQTSKADLNSANFADKVMVTQGKDEDDNDRMVKNVRATWDSNDGLEITISPADDNDDNLMADQMATLMVEDLRIAQANAVYRIQIDQGTSRARATTPRLFALTNAQASLVGSGTTRTLTITFTSALTDAVEISLPFDVDGTDVTVTGGVARAADNSIIDIATATVGANTVVITGEEQTATR